MLSGYDFPAISVCALAVAASRVDAADPVTGLLRVEL